MAQTKKNNSKKTWIIRIAAIILLIIGLGRGNRLWSSNKIACQ